MNWLQVSDLQVVIAERCVCQGLELTMEAGQCWGLLGANGAGKTTLLHTLAGLRAAAGGRIRLQGVDIHSLSRIRLARLLGLMLQDSSDPFPATVLETALLGRHPHLSRWQWEGEDDRCIAHEALVSVGLAELTARRVDTLSGGERRRLAFATLLVQQVPVMLLDEPTNHLDPFHQIRLLSLLTELLAVDAPGRPRGVAMMTLHDINLAARFCSHLLLLLPDGSVLAGPSGELLTTEVLARLYGQPMLRIENDNGVAFLPG